jgi:hypothetical protein
MKTSPVLLGEWDKLPFMGVRVWCPFCQRYHHHGWDESSYSHREAHCEQRLGWTKKIDLPFKDTGYYIKMPKKKVK